MASVPEVQSFGLVFVVVVIERDAVLLRKRGVLVVLSWLTMIIAAESQIECAGTGLLELARFFEAAMTTLLHDRAPEPRELTLDATLPGCGRNMRHPAQVAGVTRLPRCGTMTAMGRIVALFNQKGGVGKTTVTLGLASAAPRPVIGCWSSISTRRDRAPGCSASTPTTIELSTAEVLGPSHGADHHRRCRPGASRST